MGKFKLFLLSLLSIVMIGVLVFILGATCQNKAISLEEQIKVASSDIEVQEKRRVDLVYNLVDTVKEYDKHEAETLKDVVEGRSISKSNINNVSTMINAAAEAYPDLKSNENYKQLMNELSVTENLMSNYRSNYNKQVKEYNRYVKSFPNRQILSFMGYETSTFEYLEYNAPSDAPQNFIR